MVARAAIAHAAPLLLPGSGNREKLLKIQGLMSDVNVLNTKLFAMSTWQASTRAVSSCLTAMTGVRTAEHARNFAFICGLKQKINTLRLFTPESLSGTESSLIRQRKNCGSGILSIMFVNQLL